MTTRVSLGSVKGIEEFGRVRLSKTFFVRDFLFARLRPITAFAICLMILKLLSRLALGSAKQFLNRFRTRSGASSFDPRIARQRLMILAASVMAHARRTKKIMRLIFGIIERKKKICLVRQQPSLFLRICSITKLPANGSRQLGGYMTTLTTTRFAFS